MQENKSIPPLVSVVIPTYNRGRVIGRAIESVLRQTFSDFELIIVDDGSTDNSCEIVGLYDDSRIRLIRNTQNRGANFCRNIGIKESKGKYIAFQDSDDEWTTDKLEVHIRYMQENNLKASFGPYRVLETSRVVPNDFQQYVNNDGLVREVLKRYNIVGTPTLVIEKCIVNDVGMFDEQLPRMQDYDYAIRIAKKYDIGCCPHILLNVHTDEYRITSDRNKLDEAIGIIIRKHIDFLDLNHFFAIRYMVLNEGNEFSKNVFNDLISNEKFCLFVINYLKQEISLQEERRKKLLSINKRRLRNKEFAIYGAGKFARELYEELIALKIKPKYFIVSEKKDNSNIDGIRIVGVNDIHDKDITIVVAVAPATQTDILSTLFDKGFSDVFTV